MTEAQIPAIKQSAINALAIGACVYHAGCALTLVLFFTGLL